MATTAEGFSQGFERGARASTKGLVPETIGVPVFSPEVQGLVGSSPDTQMTFAHAGSSTRFDVQEKDYPVREAIIDFWESDETLKESGSEFVGYATYTAFALAFLAAPGGIVLTALFVGVPVIAGICMMLAAAGKWDKHDFIQGLETMLFPLTALGKTVVYGGAFLGALVTKPLIWFAYAFSKATTGK